jgi:REP element-mobilizing transposase RayT
VCQEIIVDCLKYANGTDYDLDTYTIAANHVHALLVVKPDQRLSEILKAWKGITARRINTHLGTSGKFWQKESYDHIVRNETALNRIRNYIRAHKK